jgi:hypothetical protein
MLKRVLSQCTAVGYPAAESSSNSAHVGPSFDAICVVAKIGILRVLAIHCFSRMFVLKLSLDC